MKFDTSTGRLDKYLWIGDPHVKSTNIEESTRLMEWAYMIAAERNIPIILAGDQYNDFGIARVEAVSFWNDMFAKAPVPIIALLGNHDANPDVSLNFMDTHSSVITVVNEPKDFSVSNGKKITMLPFYRKNADFIDQVKMAADRGSTYIYCHQEFNGCQYENGFYAPNGVNPIDIDERIEGIYSGHIHKEQSFDMVWYPGTARHLTRSDIGEEKGVWVVDNIGNTKTKILTPPEVAEPFIEITITPEFEGSLKDFKSSRIYLNIEGSRDFIKSTIKKIPEGPKVRELATDEIVVTEVKESEGVPKAFMSYVMSYANKHKLGNAEIKMITEKIYSKCPKLRGVE